MKTQMLKSLKTGLVYLSILFVAVGCQRNIEIPSERPETEVATQSSMTTNNIGKPILLTIDEESIDNGNEPNDFSETDVNDQIARIGQRSTLLYFKNNVGKNIVLYSGEVGDEGWHALKTIPNSWKTAGPTKNGAANFVAAGPGLGGGNDPEKFLDKIPNVTPLRARGLKMLVGQTILAVVYDSDVSINYSPLNGSLKGDNLGLVALQVVKVVRRTDGSSGSLPAVTVKILDVNDIKGGKLYLFSNAPVPSSSSEPYDINPPVNAPVPKLVLAP